MVFSCTTGFWHSFLGIAIARLTKSPLANLVEYTKMGKQTGKFRKQYAI
ncbi:hypothetical protein [Nostoc sp.]